MQKEIIRRNILDKREIMSRSRYVPRELALDYDFLRKTEKITVIVGPRRAGKSVFLRQIADEIGLSNDERLFIDFSEIPWIDFDPRDPDEWHRLYEVALEFSPAPVLLMDEIQELTDFSGGLRYLMNRGCAVFVTGSNVQVFEEKLATVLRGKVLVYRLYPLSFSEYLRFRDLSFSLPLSSGAAARRIAALREYLTWGGFPEVVLADSEELKRSLLDSYVEIMLFRDVVERWNVQNIAVLQRLMAKVLQSFTKDISVHRWYNDFRSQGMKMGKDTLYEYLNYLEEALFVFSVHNDAAPTGSRKVYLVDNGLYQRVKDRPDTGKLLENQVFLDNLRSGGRKPRYHRSDAGEIDFVTETHLIQVCTELSEDNRNREMAPLRSPEIRHRFPNRTYGVVTLDGYPELQVVP